MLIPFAPESTAQRMAPSACSRVEPDSCGRSGPSHIEAERTFASGAPPVGPAPTPCPAITPATAVPWWMVVFPPIGVVPSLPSPLKSLALLTTPSRSSWSVLTPESMTATLTPLPVVVFHSLRSEERRVGKGGRYLWG